MKDDTPQRAAGGPAEMEAGAAVARELSAASPLLARLRAETRSVSDAEAPSAEHLQRLADAVVARRRVEEASAYGPATSAAPSRARLRARRRPFARRIAAAVAASLLVAAAVALWQTSRTVAPAGSLPVMVTDPADDELLGLEAYFADGSESTDEWALDPAEALLFEWAESGEVSAELDGAALATAVY